MRRIHYLKVFVEGKYQIAFLLDKIRIFASFYPDKQGTERKVHKLITSHKDQVQAKTNKKKEDEKMKAKGVRVLVARSKKENKKRIRTPRLDACLIFIGPNFFHTMTSHCHCRSFLCLSSSADYVQCRSLSHPITVLRRRYAFLPPFLEDDELDKRCTKAGRRRAAHYYYAFSRSRIEKSFSNLSHFDGIILGDAYSCPRSSFCCHLFNSGERVE